MAAQAGHEGLGLPIAEWRIGSQALAPQAAAAQRRHIGLHANFVDEHQPRRLPAHEGLAAVAPFTTGAFTSQRSCSDASSAIYT
ncbi:hypothetical protein [Jiella pacifica]|uniref:Uncharacterized protein n=1 Tax=Jiella pacifica TaxID=2696469 RepID=A0A6N9T804_9HYPH|nr:hypothetical protein [Jiella pacifica]